MTIELLTKALDEKAVPYRTTNILSQDIRNRLNAERKTIAASCKQMVVMPQLLDELLLALALHLKEAEYHLYFHDYEDEPTYGSVCINTKMFLEHFTTFIDIFGSNITLFNERGKWSASINVYQSAWPLFAHQDHPDGVVTQYGVRFV